MTESAPSAACQKKPGETKGLCFLDGRAESRAQNQRQFMIDHSPRITLQKKQLAGSFSEQTVQCEIDEQLREKRDELIGYISDAIATLKVTDILETEEITSLQGRIVSWEVSLREIGQEGEEKQANIDSDRAVSDLESERKEIENRIAFIAQSLDKKRKGRKEGGAKLAYLSEERNLILSFGEKVQRLREIEALIAKKELPLIEAWETQIMTGRTSEANDVPESENTLRVWEEKQPALLNEYSSRGYLWPGFVSLDLYGAVRPREYELLTTFELQYRTAKISGIDPNLLADIYTNLPSVLRPLSDQVVAALEAQYGAYQKKKKRKKERTLKKLELFEDLFGPSEVATPTNVLSYPGIVGDGIDLQAPSELPESNVPEFDGVEGLATVDVLFSNIAGPIVTLSLGIVAVADAKKVLNDPNASEPEKALAARQLLAGVAMISKGSTGLLAGGFNVISNASNIQAASLGAATSLSEVLSTPGADLVTSGGSIITGSIIAGLNLNKAIKAGKRSTRFEKLDKSQMPIVLRKHVKYALKKSDRKLVRKTYAAYGGVIGAGSGVVGVVVSVAGILGASAVVTAATPVGWALGACAAAIGLGFGLYKGGRTLYKYVHRSSKAKDFIHGLLERDPGAEAAVTELGLLPPWCRNEIKSGRKNEVKQRIYKMLKLKKQRMAEGIFLALRKGDSDEKREARKILLDGYKIKEKYIIAAEEEADTALIQIVTSKLNSW